MSTFGAVVQRRLALRACAQETTESTEKKEKDADVKMNGASETDAALVFGTLPPGGGANLTT